MRDRDGKMQCDGEGETPNEMQKRKDKVWKIKKEDLCETNMIDKV